MVTVRLELLLFLFPDNDKTLCVAARSAGTGDGRGCSELVLVAEDDSAGKAPAALRASSSARSRSSTSWEIVLASWDSTCATIVSRAGEDSKGLRQSGQE
jgi:hypothetical protein